MWRNVSQISSQIKIKSAILNQQVQISLSRSILNNLLAADFSFKSNSCVCKLHWYKLTNKNYLLAIISLHKYSKHC